MSVEKQLQDAFSRIRSGGERIFAGKVKSVDKDAGTCVIDDGDLEFTDVRLSAAITDRDSWCYLFPEVGSSVLVSTIGGALENIAVVAVSDVEEVHVKCATTELTISAEGVHVVRQQEDLGKLIGLLIDEINKITVPTGTGPSGTPVNAAVFGQLKQKFAKVIV